MIRAVFLDIGNVVLYFSHERMCRQLAVASGTSAARVRAAIFESGFVVGYDRGDASTEDLVAALEELAGRRLDETALRRAAADIFTPNREVAELVERLSRLGLELGVLSNTCEVHTSEAIERFEVFRHLRHRIYSHRVGAVKPEAEIYRAALAAAGCAAGECFFTDDRPEYVAAARRLGLEAETFRGARHLRSQLVRRGLPV